MDNIFDFNNLTEALKNGYTDEDIAKAFTSALNEARAAEAKRKAEEAAQKELEAKKAEDARLHRQESMRFATDAAAALNAFLAHEGILREGEMCFTAEDLLDFVDEARKETNHLASMLNSLKDLRDILAAPVKKAESTMVANATKKSETNKNITPTKNTPSTDDDAFADLFNYLFG